MDHKMLAKEIKKLLDSHLDKSVFDVVIFGSQIKGCAKPDSDYDVLIILKCKINRIIRRTINELCYEIDLKYDIFLDIQVITYNDLKNGILGKHPVIEDAIKEGVHA